MTKVLVGGYDQSNRQTDSTESDSRGQANMHHLVWTERENSKDDYEEPKSLQVL